MGEGEERDDMSDRITKLEQAMIRLQSELEWVKMVVGGKPPKEHEDSTSPPWVLILIGCITPLCVAIVSTQPWK